MTTLTLSGGSGTRLWPLSRTLMPKQFLKIFGGKSLFQLTCQRNSSLSEKNYIISNEDQYFLALDQLQEIDQSADSFLLEPVGRNTAPAIALACLDMDADEILLVLPSDHLIKNEKAYKEAVQQARQEAKKGYLVTFGIKPTSPQTGYGYIKADGIDAKSFHEKPNKETAKEYLKKGNYFWNSGMFCFKAGVYLNELQIHAKDIYDASKKAYKAKKCNNPIRLDKQLMQNIPDESIDYAVMEKSTNVKMIPCDINWSDVGSFDSLSQELPNDKNGNLIISEDKTIELIDINDTIVVDTDDALLICKKGSTQKIKQLHQKIKLSNKELVTVHKTAHRPWGTYTVLENKQGYKLKRIVVNPHKKLSLQKHYHRNEHWIVVSGTATVTVDDKKFLVRPNESTYIKMGQVHRLENEGKIPIVLIEAQVGEYTGEDDIIRIQDDFKRS